MIPHLLPTGTRVCVRWSQKTGIVLPRDAMVADRRHVEIVALDPFLPNWGNELPRELTAIEVIYDRRDLIVLSEEG